MLEFRCSRLGNRCSWKHFARTEELLTDIAAIHLRDVHGVSALNAEMVGKIKRTITNLSPTEAREAESLVLKEFKCKNLGNKCDWRYIAQTEELIADGVAVHAREAHGIKEFTPELKVKVANSLQVWKG